MYVVSKHSLADSAPSVLSVERLFLYMCCGKREEILWGEWSQQNRSTHYLQKDIFIKIPVHLWKYQVWSLGKAQPLVLSGSRRTRTTQLFFILQEDPEKRYCWCYFKGSDWREASRLLGNQTCQHTPLFVLFVLCFQNFGSLMIPQRCVSLHCLLCL